MAVYTHVSAADLTQFLALYDAGNLVAHEGITQGVSNTNYFVTTDRARYVLTLFEPHRVHADDIPAFMNYAIILERAGVPCPATLVQKNGAVSSALCRRPAALFSVLEGEGGSAPMLSPALCGKAGAVLAKMHQAVSGRAIAGPNHFSLDRWEQWVSSLDAKMDSIHPGLFLQTRAELDRVAAHWPAGLPAGAIHADYFPDNVFFKDGEITGVIDFHFVCHDVFAYDLAIAINAWAFDTNNEFSQERMDAMMRGYQSVRLLTQAEHDALPVLLRAAALRFLLSRIEEKLAWTPDTMMVPHDPMVFEKRLRHFQSMDMPA